MYKILKFELARDALKKLVEIYSIEEMHIPYYLCDVIRHSLTKTGCKPLFYHIEDNFLPEKPFSQDDYILYPNYFGICNYNVQYLSNRYKNLIVDNAHAYYEKPQGFATINAGHKFNKKHSFLFYDKSNKEAKENVKLDNDAKERYKKFLELHNLYSGINQLNIKTEKFIAPFVYPCLLQNEEQADELVKILNKNNIEIYRYWNSLPKSFNEYKFYSRLVPIPLV